MTQPDRRIPAVALSILMVCAVMGCAGEAPPAAGDPVATTPAASDDSAVSVAIADLAAASFAAGLPDPAGCEFLRGGVRLEHPGAGDAGDDAWGLQLRRPDSTLLIGGLRLAAAGVTVEPRDLKQITAKPPPSPAMQIQARDSARRWLETRLHPDDAPRMPALLADLEQARAHVLAEPMSLEPGLLLILARMHHPDAALVARMTAFGVVANTPTIQTPALVFEEAFGGRHYRSRSAADDGWIAPAKRRRLPDTPSAVRLAGAEALIRLASAGDPHRLYQPMDSQRILAAAEHLAAGDAAVLERIAAVRASLAVPAIPAAGADLAARLASWIPADTDPAAPVPGVEDPAALVALLGDVRPARWIDLGWPRTVGDCALRALDRILACDPRLVIGRNTMAPWTSQERTATAAAMAAWWGGQGGKPIAQVRSDLLLHLPLHQTLELLQQADPARRTDILDRLAQAWTTPPASGMNDTDLLILLQCSEGHPGLRKAVLAWSVAGDAQRALALIHLEAGDRSHLDRLLTAALSADRPPAADGAAAWRRTLVLPLVRTYGTEEQIRSFMRMLATPGQDAIDDSPWIGAIGSLTMSAHLAPPDAKSEALTRRDTAVAILGMAVLLADERPMPEMLLQFATMTQQEAAPAAKVRLADDLRICDVGGGMLGTFLKRAYQELAVPPAEVFQEPSPWMVDLGSERAIRDQRLAHLRGMLTDKLPPLLASVHLDLPLPRASAVPAPPSRF